MSEPSAYDTRLVGLCSTDPVYSVKDVERLKHETQVGDYIEFETSVMDENGHFKKKKVSGFVETKYPFIFKLHYSDKYYSWVDYLIGRKRKV